MTFPQADCESLVTRGCQLGKERKFWESFEAFALSLRQPGEAYLRVIALNNIGQLMEGIGRFEDALSAYREAYSIDPDPRIASNLGLLLRDFGEHDEALALLRKSVELMPDCQLSRFRLGVELLTQGQFVEGWKEYDERISLKRCNRFPESFPQ